MRLRGYTESIEVLIDILDELREVKELLKQKESKEAEFMEKGGIENDHKSQTTATRQRSDRGSRSNTK